MNRIKIICSIMLSILIIQIIGLNFTTLYDNNASPNLDPINNLNTSASEIIENQWLKNTDFSTLDDWFSLKGDQGDNATIDADISSGEANYIVVGDTNNFELTTGSANSSTWYGWNIYNNNDFLLPDVAEINATGCFVYHYLNENENGGAGQVHNFPSVHFRRNVSLPNDMSDYEITSASLDVVYNASVDYTVDTPLDIHNPAEITQPFPGFGIGDSATFYVEISDLERTYSFRVAENKTKYLGQWNSSAAYPSILNITDRLLETVSEEDLITALNLALEKDKNHSDLTITIGIDIYCEDNSNVGDHDKWDALIIKSCNLTMRYEKKIEQFTSISWNQIGNQLTGADLQLINATFNFNYKIDEFWPTSASPFSEIAIIINNNKHSETIRLDTATTTYQEAKLGGFDVTSLISKDVNITVSIQVLIANTFGLGKNITLSIDDVELNITYSQSFLDIEPDLQIFINGNNKTADPFIEVPIGTIVNVTIRYLDELSLHIDGGLVQLTGVGILENLVENPTYHQYSYMVNSTEKLSLGTNLLTITTQKTNFQSKNLDFSIVVRKIETEVRSTTGNNIINVNPGGNVNLQVYLNDTDFNLPITGALILYNWNFGQGILRENNNDGTYAVNLNNVPAGSHVVTISVFGSDDYVFQEYQLTINAIQGEYPDWIPLIIILSVGMLGIIGFFTFYQTYLKYPPLVRKIRKVRKKINKDKKIKPTSTLNRELLVAKNLQDKINLAEYEHTPIEKKKEIEQIIKEEVKYKE